VARLHCRDDVVGEDADDRDRHGAEQQPEREDRDRGGGDGREPVAAGPPRQRDVDAPPDEPAERDEHRQRRGHRLGEHAQHRRIAQLSDREEEGAQHPAGMPGGRGGVNVARNMARR